MARLTRVFPGWQLDVRPRDVGHTGGPVVEESYYLQGPLTSNQDKTYKIVMLLDSYPESPPPAYALEPLLMQREGSTLATLGASQKMHTLAPDLHGNPQLCLYHDRAWSTSVTLLTMVLKARIWLEAYESYLYTGEPLDAVLGHMEAR